jgi:hypothetical protein
MTDKCTNIAKQFLGKMEAEDQLDSLENDKYDDENGNTSKLNDHDNSSQQSSID